MRLYLAKSCNVPRVLSSTMRNTCQNNTCMTSFHEFSPRVFHPTSSWALRKSFALFEYETSTQISAGFVIPLGRRFGSWQSHNNPTIVAHRPSPTASPDSWAGLTLLETGRARLSPGVYAATISAQNGNRDGIRMAGTQGNWRFYEITGIWKWYNKVT